MRINQLFESPNKKVSFCFGRMNPPTIGHKQLLDTLAKQGGDYKVFVSQTQDKKKNPLDYATKVKFIKAMFPEHSSHLVVDGSLNTVMKVASYLYDQGYTEATFVAGSDRLEDMSKLLETYNGVEGKSHGYYKFDKLDFVSSGDREDGAEGVAGVSASNARAAAAEGNEEAFAQSTGTEGEMMLALYKAVRAGMGIKDAAAEEAVAGYVNVNKYKVGSKIKHTLLPKGGFVEKVEGNAVFVRALHDGRLYRLSVQHANMAEGKTMKAKDFVPASKPRNPVAKNANAAIGGGAAGAHKDKKKAAKQGEVKHRGKKFDEASDWGSMSKREFKRRELEHELGHEDRLARQQDAKPQMIGMYFYDVPAEKEQDARVYGIKKTKSGKFAMVQYDKSGRTFAYNKNLADKEFGPGKWWSPKK